MKFMSFEFGVSLGTIDFIQNEVDCTEDECTLILTKFMEKNEIECEVKTHGLVMWDEGDKECQVLTRPYVEDWSWDFDHEDTTEVMLSL